MPQSERKKARERRRERLYCGGWWSDGVGEWSPHYTQRHYRKHAEKKFVSQLAVPHKTSVAARAFVLLSAPRYEFCTTVCVAREWEQRDREM